MNIDIECHSVQLIRQRNPDYVFEQPHEATRFLRWRENNYAVCEFCFQNLNHDGSEIITKEQYILEKVFQ